MGIVEDPNSERIIEEKFEKKIINSIQKDLDVKLDNIKNDLIKYFEKNIKEILIKEIKQMSNLKINNFLENREEMENNVQKENNKINNIDNEQPLKDREISDFIVGHKKNELKNTYYEPNEIDEQNEKIISSINDKVYENYLPEKENLINETVGKFFYSIGGISRVSQSMANKVYYKLFKEYKKYLKNNNMTLTFNHVTDRKNLSIWTKNYLKEKEFYDYYSNKNIQEIKKYLYKEDENSNKILKELFTKLIALYTKCRLSYPSIVTTEYTNNNSEFLAKTMIDCTLKYERNKKVNFCYFPALIANGKFLRNGNYYVFTYSLKNKTFHIEGNIYDHKIEEQKPKLYLIPEPKTLKFHISQIEDKIRKQLKVIMEPSISPELNPKFILYKWGNQKCYKVNENDTGIFDIDKGNYYIKLFYANNLGKNSELFEIS